jgi:hypothetical protein
MANIIHRKRLNVGNHEMGSDQNSFSQVRIIPQVR